MSDGKRNKNKNSSSSSQSATANATTSPNSNSNSNRSRKKAKKKQKKLIKRSVVGGMIEFPLGPLKEHLTCPLCEGFLREAYTISECLHSFCKSCLYSEYSRGCTKCPECNVNLGPDPYPVTIHDRTLQELVDSILPQLKTTDDKEERAYYKRKGIKLKPEFQCEIGEDDGDGDSEDECEGEDEDEESYASPVKGKGKLKRAMSESPTNKQVKKRAKITAEDIAEDEIDFEVQPQSLTDGKQKGKVKVKVLPSLKKSQLRTSGKLKIFQLKKFLVSQLKLGTDGEGDTLESSISHSELEVRCNGAPVGDELSLTFIKKTRCLTDEGLFLTYGLMDSTDHNLR